MGQLRPPLYTMQLWILFDVAMRSFTMGTPVFR